jgi:hypothetical protein
MKLRYVTNRLVGHAVDMEWLSRWAIPEPNSGCLLWVGEARGKYPYVGVHGRTRYAHRVAYEIAYGAVPTGLEVDHLCKVTFCINPDHLEAVTRTVNVRRSRAPEANRLRGRQRTHCKNGHEYEDSSHRCRICRELSFQRFAERHPFWWRDRPKKEARS